MVGEDEEKLEALCTTDANVNGVTSVENATAIPKTFKYKIII